MCLRTLKEGWYSDIDAFLKSLCRWFRAEDHFYDMMNFAKDFSHTAYRTLSVLDLFGASQRVSQTWQRAGYQGMSFDIKIDPKHDICSREGFLLLLRSGLRFLVSKWYHFGSLLVFTQNQELCWVICRPMIGDILFVSVCHVLVMIYHFVANIICVIIL